MTRRLKIAVAEITAVLREPSGYSVETVPNSEQYLVMVFGIIEPLTENKVVAHPFDFKI